MKGDIQECLKTLDTAEDHFRRHGTRKSDHKSSWFSLSSTNKTDLVKCLENVYAALEKYEEEKYEEALEVLGDFDNTKRLALQMPDD